MGRTKQERVQLFHLDPIEREKNTCDWDGDWPHWSVILCVSGMKRQRIPASGVSIQPSPHCWCDLFQLWSLCLPICPSGPEPIPCLYDRTCLYTSPLQFCWTLNLSSNLWSWGQCHLQGSLFMYSPAESLRICQQGQLELPEFCFNFLNPFVVIK